MANKLFKVIEVLGGLSSDEEIYISVSFSAPRLSVVATTTSKGRVVVQRLREGELSCCVVPWTSEPLLLPNALAFSPTAEHLLIAVNNGSLYVLPLWSLWPETSGRSRAIKPTPPSDSRTADPIVDEVLMIPNCGSRAKPSALVWWQPSGGDLQIAIIGTVLGELCMVELTSGREVGGTYITQPVASLALCSDNALDATNLLIRDQSGHEFHLLLEHRSHRFLFPLELHEPDGGESALQKHSPGVGGTKGGLPEPLCSWLPERGEHVAAPQYSNSSYLISLHDTLHNTLKVYNPERTSCPVRVYRLVPEAREVLLQEPLLFCCSAPSRLCVMATSAAATPTDSEQPASTKMDHILEEVELPMGCKILRLLPFGSVNHYHDTSDELTDALQEEEDDTVVEDLLAGRRTTFAPSCLVVTTRALYVCQLTESAEHLFLYHLLDSCQQDLAHRLASVFCLDVELYEVAADAKLREKKFAAALSLYKHARFSHTRCALKLARYGLTSEFLSYAAKLLSGGPYAAEVRLEDKQELSTLSVVASLGQLCAVKESLSDANASFLRESRVTGITDLPVVRIEENGADSNSPAEKVGSVQFAGPEKLEVLSTNKESADSDTSFRRSDQSLISGNKNSSVGPGDHTKTSSTNDQQSETASILEMSDIGKVIKAEEEDRRRSLPSGAAGDEVNSDFLAVNSKISAAVDLKVECSVSVDAQNIDGSQCSENGVQNMNSMNEMRNQKQVDRTIANGSSCSSGYIGNETKSSIGASLALSGDSSASSGSDQSELSSQDTSQVRCKSSLLSSNINNENNTNSKGGLSSPTITPRKVAALSAVNKTLQSKFLLAKFLVFLKNNQHYDPVYCLCLAVEAWSWEIVQYLCSTRGLMLEKLCVLMHSSGSPLLMCKQSGKSKSAGVSSDDFEEDATESVFVRRDAEFGYLHCLSDPELRGVLLSNGNLAWQHHHKTLQLLPSLTLPVLIRFASLYDPSQPALATFLASPYIQRHFSLDAPMETDLECEVPSIPDIVHVFLSVLVCINEIRGWDFSMDFVKAESAFTVLKSVPDDGGLQATDEVLLCCGFSSSAAVLHGRLYCWGSARGGVLGLGPMPRFFEEGKTGTSLRPSIKLSPVMAQVKALHDESKMASAETLVLPSGVRSGTSHTSSEPPEAGQRSSGAGTGPAVAGGNEDLIDPRFVEGLSHTLVRAVACGKSHMLALTTSGVYGWGSNSYGEVGNGSTGAVPRPVLLTSASLQRLTITAVACGQFHSLALSSSGRVLTWGWGVHGQLGHGSVEDCHSPTVVFALRRKTIVNIAAGYAHSVCMDTKGCVYAWGCSVYGQCGTGNLDKLTTPKGVVLPSPVTHIAAGYFHNICVTSKGELWSWGCNPTALKVQAHLQRRSRAAKSQEEQSDDSSEAKQSSGGANGNDVQGSLGAGKVSGSKSTLSLEKETRNKSSASASSSQHNDCPPSSKASASNMKGIAAVRLRSDDQTSTKSESRSAAVLPSSSSLDNIKVPCAADAKAPHEGAKEPLKDPKGPFEDPKAILEDPKAPFEGTKAPLEGHKTCSSDRGGIQNSSERNGKLWRVGEASESNTVPSCDPEDLSHLLPSLVPMPPEWGECKALSAGGQHSALLTTQGVLYTWGRNLCGQLGTGARQECVRPTAVMKETFITAVACGADCTLVADQRRQVWGFGSNFHSQLGGVGSKGSGGGDKGQPGRVFTLKTAKRVLKVPHSIHSNVEVPRIVQGLPSVAPRLPRVEVVRRCREFERWLTSLRFYEAECSRDKSSALENDKIQTKVRHSSPVGGGLQSQQASVSVPQANSSQGPLLGPSLQARKDERRVCEDLKTSNVGVTSTNLELSSPETVGETANKADKSAMNNGNDDCMTSAKIKASFINATGSIYGAAVLQKALLHLQDYYDVCAVTAELQASGAHQAAGAVFSARRDYGSALCSHLDALMISGMEPPADRCQVALQVVRSYLTSLLQLDQDAPTVAAGVASEAALLYFSRHDLPLRELEQVLMGEFPEVLPHLAVSVFKEEEEGTGGGLVAQLTPALCVVLCTALHHDAAADPSTSKSPRPDASTLKQLLKSVRDPALLSVSSDTVQAAGGAPLVIFSCEHSFTAEHLKDQILPELSSVFADIGGIVGESTRLLLAKYGQSCSGVGRANITSLSADHRFNQIRKSEEDQRTNQVFRDVRKTKPPGVSGSEDKSIFGSQETEIPTCIACPVCAVTELLGGVSPALLVDCPQTD
ncbi:Regulator of chromosome condensation RCC1 [Trinorchestia longiramus]|nr:Regulator of chromosome condensation RCC1 [Trinorchestia longiramus]